MIKKLATLIGLSAFIAGWANADEIVINPDTPPLANGVSWNTAIWGDPAAVPTSEHDYVNDMLVLAGMGTTHGPFLGKSLTLKSGGDLYMRGGGQLGGRLILDGGQLQNRVGANPSVFGEIHVASLSAVVNISGNLFLRTTLSGTGTLRIRAHNNTSDVTVDCIDAGYTGLFDLRNAAANDARLSVFFTQSYEGAGLTFQGGNLSRAPVYQLTNDIAFVSISMPSAADASVKIDLPEGTYDAAALIAAGVHTDYFNDLGGTLTVGAADGPQKIRINPSIASETYLPWNDPIWGDPAAAPTAEEDYLNNRAWLGGLGAGLGSFTGKSLILEGAGELWLDGGGDLGAPLILDGGRIQNRAEETAVMLGTIQVDSTSRILNTSGADLELATELSGPGNLELKAYVDSSTVTVSGTDTGFTGTFDFKNSDSDDAYLTVQFNESFEGANLRIEGGSFARGGYLQLVNDISFLGVSMPSADHIAVLVDLPPGTYDGPGLVAAGLSDHFFNDLGGTLTVGPTATPADFESWRAHYFDGDLEDPEISGPNASPAGDGVKNLLKYALNLDPWEAASASDLPSVDLNEDGDLVLVYSKRTDIDDIEYIPEVSGDLAGWLCGEPNVTETAGEEINDRQEMEALGNLPEDPATGFMRLTVQPKE